MNYLLFLFALTGHLYEATGLIHEEHKLNSGARPGGLTRAVIKVTAPPHTECLVYSLMASPNNPLSALGLHTQLRDKISKEGAALSIGSTLLNNLFVPPGDGVTDVLVMDSTNAATFAAKKAYQYQPDYSRLNIANCIVIIPIKYSNAATTLYIGLRNPTAFDAEFLTIEVEAIKRL